MRHFTDITNPEIARLLLAGKVGVVRTDTIYGLLAKADNEPAVERVFEIKGRSNDKSPIVLVASVNQLFDVPSEVERQVCTQVWPGKVSVIIPTIHAPAWIERGNHSVAYRLPDDADLRGLLEKTGPLIAPSANPQGKTPAMTVQQAVEYFGDTVDFYVDGGDVTDNTPSQLVRIDETGKMERFR